MRKDNRSDRGGKRAQIGDAAGDAGCGAATGLRS